MERASWSVWHGLLGFVCIVAVRITPHCVRAAAWKRGSNVQVGLLLVLHLGEEGLELLLLGVDAHELLQHVGLVVVLHPALLGR